jgi:uncharacterized protein (DUF1800 family)
MQTTRRDLLRAGLATATVGALGGLTGCAEINQRLSPARDAARLPDKVDPADIRLANRLGFGPAGEDLVQIRELGQEAYVEKSLKADQPEEFMLNYQLRRLDAPAYDAYDLRDMPEDQVLTQLQTGTILRSVYGANQLRERLVDFWSNHFNIYGRKGLAAYRLAKDGREVVRANALGNFGDMLLASAQSPAMLMYLDNHFNSKAVPNENYAREIMELHTMGVDGGYTQRDVMEVARCLTGWCLETRRPWEAKKWTHRGTFRFDEEAHDDGEKTVLGHRIPAGGGQNDGKRVIEILISHPSTARHVCRKLCRTFIGTPDAKVRPEAERAFLDSKGDVRATLRPILMSKEILEGPPILRRPFDFLVAAVRATGAQTDGSAGIQAHLTAMGQPLNQWLMPDGYTEEATAWTGTMLARWNFVLALAEGRIPGTKLADTSRTQQTLGHLSQHPSESLAVALLAPEYQWR